MYNKGDYIVLEDDKNLYCIDKIEATDYDYNIYVTIVNSYVEDNSPKLIEDNSRIVANLGNQIANTNSHVYRASTNLFQGRSNNVGRFYYVDYKTFISEEDKSKLEEILREVSFNKLFTSLLTSIGIGIEIVNIRSRWVGKYVPCGNYRKDYPDKILLNLIAYDKDHIKRILYHELGHAMWNRLFIAVKDKNKFINMYLKSKQVFDIDKDRINNIRMDLLKTTSIRAYLSTLMSAEESILKQSLGQIYRNYGLKPEDLDVLIESGDDLSKYFPKSLTFVKTNDEFVSKYSMTNVHEFFCESFSAYMLGIPIDNEELENMLKDIVPDSYRDFGNDKLG